MPQNVIGPLIIEGDLGIAGGSLELGNNLLEIETPYIDFHFGTGSAEDFNVRVINSQNRRLDFATQLDGTMLSLNAGNVGIGTTSPAAKLEVKGAIKAMEILTSGSLRVSGAANLEGTLNVNGAAELGANTHVVGDLRVDNSGFFAGNVGIGTASPQRKLQISEEDVAGISFEGFTASPNVGAIRFGDGTGWKFHIGRSRETSTGALNDRTTGVLMTIQDNGNVGIGTTSPSTKFHFVGDQAYFVGTASNRYATMDVDNTGNGPIALFRGNGNVGIGTASPSEKLDLQNGRLRVGNTQIWDNEINRYNNDNLFIGYRNTANTVLQANGGNVGVGTADLKGKLSVHSSIEEETGLFLTSTKSNKSNAMINVSLLEKTDETHRLFTARKINSAGNARLDWTFELDKGDEPGMQFWRAFRPYDQDPNFVSALHLAWNGNVGIGTAEPKTKLHVHGGRLLVTESDGAGESAVLELSNGAKTNYIFTQARTGDLYLRTDSANHDVILQAGGTQGNVGIGTTNPKHPIHVGGGAYCEGGKIWQNASSREYKKAITPLAIDQALEALAGLNPVTFRFKETTADEKHVGFIAEEVPELVASKDRKGLSAMDIVGVLTKVVQYQQQEIEKLKADRRDRA